MLKPDPTFCRFSHANEREIVSRLPWFYQYGPFAIVSTVILAFTLSAAWRGEVFSMPWFFWVLWGLVGAFTFSVRNDLRIDVVKKTYTKQQGLFPFVRTQEGDLDEFEEIIIEGWGESTLHKFLCLFFRSVDNGSMSLLMLRGSNKHLQIDGNSPADIDAHRETATQLAAILKLPIREKIDEEVKKFV
ncbi:MAG TPA: hypothetical protein DCE42_17570 [Myxococcales bacterium]|nr:hypothetical protein [Deltaproteobacteria bacterium]MBU53996.1 hypothetical protein [Deltaproteobacteria bacterium]HAA56577.1 hypothetical protein [Myxococcales bacterium]|tara:strand:+ start:18057 stop:18620 length:564 start_codon:yes stop_codon:yes gene_type:complete